MNMLMIVASSATLIVTILATVAYLLAVRYLNTRFQPRHHAVFMMDMPGGPGGVGGTAPGLFLACGFLAIVGSVIPILLGFPTSTTNEAYYAIGSLVGGVFFGGMFIGFMATDLGSFIAEVRTQEREAASAR